MLTMCDGANTALQVDVVIVSCRHAKQDLQARHSFSIAKSTWTLRELHQHSSLDSIKSTDTYLGIADLLL